MRLATKTPVIAKHKDTREVIRFPSMADAARFFGCNSGQIYRCCIINRHPHKGYFFCKESDMETREGDGK